MRCSLTAGTAETRDTIAVTRSARSRSSGMRSPRSHVSMPVRPQRTSTPSASNSEGVIRSTAAHPASESRSARVTAR